MSQLPSQYDCSISEVDRNRYLDGEPHDTLTAYLEHLRDCSACSNFHRVAVQFCNTPPELILPPSDFASRIFAAVQADRIQPRRVKQHWGKPFFMVASCLLLCCGMIWWFGNPPSVPVSEGMTRVTPVESEKVTASNPGRLKDRISSAGSALLARTQRATSETIPNIPLPMTLRVASASTRAETYTTLDHVGSGASSTLAPIASSTRRMIHLFRKEFPAVEPQMKPNS